MATHTPGPWTAHLNEPGPRGGPCCLIEAANGSITIAKCDEDLNVLPDEMEANAHLMAAAPDMLAALESLLDLHVAHHNAPEHVAARAAIAKATGQ